MRGKLTFSAGVGLGYLLGTRAGRERFDQISEKAKQLWESKTVQDAAGVVQEQAGRLYEGGKHLVSDQAHKVRDHRHDRELRGKRQPTQEATEQAAWEAPVGFPANTSY